jgi:hypothetical protein
VRTLDKLAGQRCKHQRVGKGCMVYHKAGMPPECILWNCRWLVNDDAAELSRPDRSHYVVDVMPDFVTTVSNETGERLQWEVIQIWVDPGYPDAHRDPALRAWLIRQRTLALIRYSAERGFVLCPPNMSETGEWIERTSDMKVETHSVADVVEALGGQLKIEIRERVS